MLLRLCKLLPCSSLAQSPRRGVASKAKLDSPYNKKMEALVSLYHQSSTFITPENLSTAIDEAFAQPSNVPEHDIKYSMRDLHEMRKTLRESRKFFLGRDVALMHNSRAMGPGWTESGEKRVDRVYRALMGTQNDGRPSWLALKENSKRVKSQIDKDS